MAYETELNKNKYFSIVVTWLCDHFQFDDIVETGTFMGTGSTTIFARTGIKVTTIECNKQRAAEATKNLQKFPNVTVIHGLSMDRKGSIEFMLQNDHEYPFGVQHDVRDLNQERDFYVREVNVECPTESVLPLLINNEQEQLIFLDSAGGMGFYEFKEGVMALQGEQLKKKTVIFDDVNHIKHYRSVKLLEDAGYCVNYDWNLRFAWCKL